MSIRGRLILIFVLVVAILGCAGMAVVWWMESLLKDQAIAGAEGTSLNVASATRTFGETADMDGLKLYLGSYSGRTDVVAIHAIRGAMTVKDFKARKGSEASNEIERQVLASGVESKTVDAGNHQIRIVYPILAAERCTECHLSAKKGDVLGASSTTVSTEYIDTILRRTYYIVAAGFAFAVLVAIIVVIVQINRNIIDPVNNVTRSLTSGSDRVTVISRQFAASSQQMAEGSSEQASSLEETSAALEELASMTRQNADNANQANNVARQAADLAGTGVESMKHMVEAIDKIKKSASETAKIIKTIDEIAFQTNLLALNAAVEAARAGEAGKGFAVVAEEVRNLARRSADAAKTTAAMIEGSQKNAEAGVKVTAEVAKNLAGIKDNAGKVATLIAEIATASKEQSQGIDQVNTAVAEMDKVVQQNASTAEESSSAAAELLSQSEELKSMVGGLAGIVTGAAKERDCQSVISAGEASSENM